LAFSHRADFNRKTAAGSSAENYAPRRRLAALSAVLAGRTIAAIGSA